MVKSFIKDRKNILKIIATIIFCAAICSAAEIFLFKGRLIVFSVIFALGCATTLIIFYFRNYKSKAIQKFVEEKNVENLKAVKFYDVSGTKGAFELSVDFFNVRGISSKCRLMLCLEGLPIFFIAVQVVIAVASGRTVGYLWVAELLFFFIMVNINMQLSFIYKNSLCAGKEIKNYENDFENHILLHKFMIYTYAFTDVIIVILGFLCIFFPALNRYWQIILIVFTLAVLAVVFGVCRARGRDIKRTKGSRGK